MRRFGMSVDEAGKAILKFGTSIGALEKLSRKRRGQGLFTRDAPIKKWKPNKKNIQVLKAPSKHELPLKAAVVLDEDGFVRMARTSESPVGVVISRSHRMRNGVATFYASVAQYVERPGEIRKVEGSPLLEAPDRRDGMYGGGSRAEEGREDISEFIERRERGETTEGDLPRSEHEGVRLRQKDWQRESSLPNWDDAE